MAGDATPVSAAVGAARRRARLDLSHVYYGYWLVGAAFVAQFVSVGSSNYVIGAFLTPMTADLGWTRSEFTLSRTLGQFVMAFTGFFIGAYVDRRGGRRLMMIGVSVLAGALFLSSFVQTLWQWILLNGLMLTVGSAMIGNLVVNVTLSKWFVEKRGRVIGFSSMGVSFAGVLLTPLMTAVVDGWGWRAAWRWMALGAVLLIYPVSLLMRRAPEDYGLYPDGKSEAEIAAGMGQTAAAEYARSLTRAEALRTPVFYLIVLAFALFGMAISVMLLQTIPFMTDAGYSRTTASLMITVISVPALLSKPVWGYLIDRMDVRRLSAASAGMAGLALVTIVFSVNAGLDAGAYGGFFLLGAGWGGIIPLQEVVWASFFGRRYLGAVRSAGLPFSLALSAGGPLLASAYFDAAGDYNGAFLAVAAACVAAAALMLLVKPPQRRNQA